MKGLYDLFRLNKEWPASCVTEKFEIFTVKNYILVVVKCDTDTEKLQQ